MEAYRSEQKSATVVASPGQWIHWLHETLWELVRGRNGLKLTPTELQVMVAIALLTLGRCRETLFIPAKRRKLLAVFIGLRFRHIAPAIKSLQAKGLLHETVTIEGTEYRLTRPLMHEPGPSAIGVDKESKDVFSQARMAIELASAKDQFLMTAVLPDLTPLDSALAEMDREDRMRESESRTPGNKQCGPSGGDESEIRTSKSDAAWRPSEASPDIHAHCADVYKRMVEKDRAAESEIRTSPSIDSIEVQRESSVQRRIEPFQKVPDKEKTWNREPWKMRGNPEQKELMEECWAVFGKASMDQYAGGWFSHVKEKPEKVRRILADVKTQLKESLLGARAAGPIKDAGAVAADLWKRWP